MLITIGEKIKVIAKKKGYTMRQVAEQIGCTTQNMYLKMKRGNWTEADLKKYAEAIGCTYEVIFIDKDTGERL